ncbi:uncharacterized protein MONBRDRAFT_8472, partial [Monosiga brevicollis MX1]
MASSLDPNVVPGTGFLVDCFRDKKKIAAGQKFFLSHYHADHYGGLNDKWAAGPIYASPPTARLVIDFLEVDPKWIHELPFDETHTIDDVEVTLMDANHCPGAAMLLFGVRNQHAPEQRMYHLHTGDCRFHPRMLDHPTLQGIHIENLYLDTTYANPKYTFPPQEDTIEFCARTIAAELEAHRGRTLVLVATYSIGKEKILLRAHELVGARVEVTERKWKMLNHCLPIANLETIFTTEHLPAHVTTTQAASVRIVGWHELGNMAPGGWTFLPDYPKLHEMLDFYASRFDRIVAFYPTGWTYTLSQAVRERQAITASQSHAQTLAEASTEARAHLTARPAVLHAAETKNKVTVYTVPYSEHSSFDELRALVSGIRPTNVVPTVLGGARDTSKQARLRRVTALFADLCNRTKATRAFVQMIQGERQNSLRRRQRSDTTPSLASTASEQDLQEPSDEFDPPTKYKGNGDDKIALPFHPDLEHKPGLAAGQDSKLGPQTRQRACGASEPGALAQTLPQSPAVKKEKLAAQPSPAPKNVSNHVPCPSCGLPVAFAQMNTHLDTCLGSALPHGSPKDSAHRGREPICLSDDEDEEPECAKRGDGAMKVDSASTAGTSSPLMEDDSSSAQDQIAQLRTILGAHALTKSGASRLLVRAHGELDQAVNLFFDETSGLTSPPAQPGTQDTNLTDSPTRQTKPTGKRKQASLLTFFQSPPAKNAKQRAAATSSPRTGATASHHVAPTEAERDVGSEQPPIPNAKPTRAPVPLVASATPADAADTANVGSDDVHYRILANAFEELVATRSRLKITSILADTFRTVLRRTQSSKHPIGDPQVLIAAVYLTTNHIAPSFHGIEPMLGKITRDLGEVMTRLAHKEFQADFKYDGCRAQIHLETPTKLRQ